MKKSASKRFLAWVLALFMVVTYMPSISYATDAVQTDTDVIAEEPATEDQTTQTVSEENLQEIPLLDGKLLVHNTLTRGSYDSENGVVTVTAPGDPLKSVDPNVVTIYNKTSKAALVSFDYQASNYREFNKTNDPGPGPYTFSATFNDIIEAGSGEVFSIKGLRASGDNTAVLTLSNFTFKEIKDESQLTFEFDPNLGNVSIAGENISSGDEFAVKYGDGAAMTAEAQEGARFLGWIDENGKVYSREASYTLKPMKDSVIKAVFINDESKGHYLAGGGKNQYLFDDFETAANKALSLTERTMVLMNDTTLTAGNYKVPEGVTLLIPFDDANTLYTTEPCATHGEYSEPVAYRTLTMAEGASLEIDGALSLSANMNAASGSNRASAAPTGDVSFIDMAEGSSIIVKDGAALYAYGYITGEGTVTAKNGSTVFENFQLEDFKGGSITSEMVESGYGVLPVSQYYVQNIEVPLTLEQGAKEKAVVCVHMSSNIFTVPIDFISNDNAMFNLTSGSVVKRYDGSKDRLIVESSGNMSLSPITVTIGDPDDTNSQSVNSKGFKLPINSNITVEIKSNTVSIDQDLSLYPGAEILIDEGAECKLNNDAKVYIYDADQWGNYCATNKSFLPVTYAPGRTYDRKASDLVDAKVLVNGTLDASNGYIYATTNADGDSGFANVCSTKNGVVKTKSGFEEYAYQFNQAATEETDKYPKINILPFNLMNEDGSFVQTYDFDEAGTYRYVDGNWACSHEVANESKSEPTCTENGARTVTCAMFGHTYTEVIPATGHDGLKHAANEATCEEPGNHAYWECEICHKKYADGAMTEEIDPTIPPLGHDEVIHEAKAPSCGVVGWEEYVTCSKCDYSTYEGKEISALEHDSIPVEAKEKTCVADGNRAHWVCKNCFGKFEDEACTKLTDPVIPAGHDWDIPDCESPRTCTTCGITQGEAGEHSWKDATCTAPKTCTVCGKTEGEALEHEWNEPTCIEPKTCSNCGTTEGEALGHDEETHVAKPASCLESGWDAYVTCKRADCDYSTKVELSALGHNPVKVDAKEATCTEEGNIKHWDCDRAGCDLLFADNLAEEVLEAEEVVIKKKDHKEVVDPAVKATCEEPGLTEGSHCDVCKMPIKVQVELPELGHAWDEGKITTKPTAEKEGIRTFTCKNDPEHKRHETVAMLTENTVMTYDDFIKNLAVLEDIANDYVKENPGKDPLKLIIKYIRTGVDRYNSGSWNIMGGYEDPDFAAFVANREYEYNELYAGEEDFEKMVVTGMKNIEEFTLPNGEYADLGHVFGTMDLTYTNPENAEVGGWAGDLVDLFSLTDFAGVDNAATVNEMADYIRTNYLGKERSELADEGYLPNAEEDEDGKEDPKHYNEGVFSYTDIIGDLDAYYIMKQIQDDKEYEAGDLTALFKGYFTEDLNTKQRAGYLIEYRLNGQTLRTDLRDEVYKVYTSNGPVTTLEGTRDWNYEGDLHDDMREAVCYAFADYICKLAGDYFEELENEYFTVQDIEKSTLAPGVTQRIVKAESSDKLPMSYYIATVDVTREDVGIYANYSTRPVEKDENGNYKWDMKRVIDQANNVQQKYGDPNSADYIPNYNVVVATNGDGYNMHTGEPGGLLLMDGIEYHPCDGSGFFGILADGTAKIGTQAEYEQLKEEGKIKEAIGGFGATLVKDGKIAVTVNSDYFNDRAPRTAIGITKTGKVVMMVMDGRQQGSTLDSACGGSAIEIAQVMLDAGCEEAINLDGGGSSTFVSKQEGSSELAVINRPCDGTSRSVSTSLYVVSTVPSSTEFDHAVIDSEYNYMTAGTTIQMTATGVSATNNPVDLPEGTTWAVSDTDKATITEDGKLTAKFNGTVNVNLMLDKEIIGTKTINIVVPDNLYFSKKVVNMVYEESIELPIKAVYNNKPVAINEKDINFELSNNTAGTFDGFKFTAAATELENVTITAKIPSSLLIKATLTVRLYNEDEARFDFDNAAGGDAQLAWKRIVTNSASKDDKTYTAVNRDENMITEYTFAIDMSQIEIPEKLADLTYMLPGSDKADATAWTFLCDLAERISEWTEVSAKIVFDKDVQFDESSIKDINLVNDYFEINKEKTVFDEEENSLTVTLNWVKQDKAIDIEMANPLCILSNIKIAPKDGVEWPEGKLDIVNTGNISYKVHMRANALYSFSSKVENQEIFGLYPYEQDRDGKIDRGGYFENVYNTFEDSYSLDKSVKNGWAMGDGGFRYYLNDEILKGIHKIDGYYYKFDEETGINEGKKKYTGEYIESKGKEYYIKDGEIHTGSNGWILMKNGEFRYYNPDKGGIREKVTKNEVKSTCIIDGYCDYTAASGATYHQPYDNAAGHEFATNKDGRPQCKECGWVQFDMSECNVRLNKTEWTYTGKNIRPTAYATHPETGKELKRSKPYPDYIVKYENNVEVGMAKAVVTAGRYGMYTDLRSWRGNYSGSVTINYLIRPAEATNVKYTINSKNVATITWSESTSADDYRVQYSTNYGKTWNTADTVTGTKYTMTLNKKYNYMFRVIARAKGKNASGNDTVYNAAVYSIAELTPVKTIKVTNDVKTGKPKVSWAKTSNADKYRVYRAISSKGTYSSIATTSKNYYIDTNAKAGKKYYYKVRAVYSKNEQANSKLSSYVERICDVARPANFKVTNDAKTGRPKVSWSKVSGADKYKIYRATSSKGTYYRLTTTSRNYYVDTKAAAGKRYYYKVKAIYSKNEYADSALTGYISRVCDLARPTLTLSNSTKGRIKVTWKKVSGANSYKVYRKVSGGSWKLVKTTTGTSYTNKSLKKGKVYYYRAIAVKKGNSNANSSYSLTKSKRCR